MRKMRHEFQMNIRIMFMKNMESPYKVCVKTLRSKHDFLCTDANRANVSLCYSNKIFVKVPITEHKRVAAGKQNFGNRIVLLGGVCTKRCISRHALIILDDIIVELLRCYNSFTCILIKEIKTITVSTMRGAGERSMAEDNFVVLVDDLSLQRIWTVAALI